MSGDALDYENASFDTVSISNSLHHLGNINHTLDEMYRVLKPGGLFIINEIFMEVDSYLLKLGTKDSYKKSNNAVK